MLLLKTTNMFVSNLQMGQKNLSYAKDEVQVILFEIDFAIFYTNLHKLFCQFISG